MARGKKGASNASTGKPNARGILPGPGDTGKAYGFSSTTASSSPSAKKADAGEKKRVAAALRLGRGKR